MAAVGYLTGDPNKVDVSSVGQVGGPAGPLDASGLIPSAQIPGGGGGGGGPSLAGTVTDGTSYGTAPAAGVATTASRGDHTHGTPALSTTPATASAVGDTAAAGTATTPARADHTHGREGFGAVSAQTSYGAASGNGSASTVARSDHTHGTPSLTSSAATSSTPGDSAAAGTATAPARADHVHGRESFGAVTAQTSFGASSGSGSAATPARSDHTHGTPAAPTPASIGADAAGAATTAVASHSSASDPHGDRADAASKYVKVAGGSIIQIGEGDVTTQALIVRLPTGDRTAGGAPDTLAFYVNTGTAGSPVWSRTGYWNEYGMPRVISVADNQVPFRVKGKSATQSANLTEWTDINNVALAWVDASGRVRGPNLGQVLPFSLAGTVAVSTGKARLYNDTGVDQTIRAVRASVGTAPTGSSLIVDIKKNGTTIFTTSANRPTIAASANTSGRVTNMDVTAFAAGDYLTVDVVQVGSTVAGSDLTVQILAY